MIDNCLPSHNTCGARGGSCSGVRAGGGAGGRSGCGNGFATNAGVDLGPTGGAGDLLEAFWAEAEADSITSTSQCEIVIWDMRQRLERKDLLAGCSAFCELEMVTIGFNPPRILPLKNNDSLLRLQ